MLVRSDLPWGEVVALDLFCVVLPSVPQIRELYVCCCIAHSDVVL
jgi:hypothetical protein